MRRVLVFVIGYFTTCATLAQAHAFLDSAEPAVGSTVRVSPSLVKIWFTKQIVRARSGIEVFNAQGAEVDLKDDKIGADSAFLLSVSVPRLAPGAYRVVWNAVCRDTHHTTGSFTFNVAGP